jgi:hypothetical protein
MTTPTMSTAQVSGDPDQVRRISAQLAAVEGRAQEIESRLRAIESGVGPQMWRGEAADSFTRLLGETGPDLTRLAISYGAASQALATYATELAVAQDTARAAEAEATTATADRDRATADRDTARSDADRHAAAASEAQQRLDPAAAQDAEQRRADALQRENIASTAIGQAEQALQAARQKAEQAAGQRDSAAARCVRELDDASRAGIDTRNLTQTPTAAESPLPATPAESGLLSGLGHLALDLVGLVPLVGEAADGINAAWYAAEGDYANAALSAAATIPGLGVTATLAKHLRKGSGVVRGVDAAPGPHTQLAPQGGLQRHEDAGGHTLDPNKAHVGATDQQILNRVAAEPRRSAVSSYNDRAAAEQASSENMVANRTAIQNWLNSNPNFNEAFDWKHNWNVGRRAPRGTTDIAGIQDVSGSRVVLRPDPNMSDGYRIQTTYPIRSQDVNASAW